MEPKKFAESELIINGDGSCFHLHLRPEQLADKVILVGDPARVNTVAAHFDIVECEVSSREFHTITGTYKGKRITDIITQGPMDIGFISGGSGVVAMNNLNDVQRGFLLRNMAELDTLADVILIDTGAGVSASVLDFVANCQDVILVTTADPSSLTDAYSLLKALTIRHF